MILYTRKTEYTLASPQPNEFNFSEQTYYYFNNGEYVQATSYDSGVSYYVKSYSWVPIPALQGQSVYLSSGPNTFISTEYILADPQPTEDNFNEKTYYYLNAGEYIEATSYNSEIQYYIKTDTVDGWTWTMVDERSGETTTVSVYNGNSITVDEQSAINGNISLWAVSYAQQSLTDSAQLQARSNINAMKAVPSSAALGANQFITYSTINNSWEAAEMLATAADISNMFGG